MTFQLKNPPLREAIFELFADPDATTQWSSSPENVLKQLPEYAHHEERMQDFGIQFQVGPDGPVAREYTPQNRIRRWNQAHQTAVQLGSHMCAYNILGGDYRKFEDHVEGFARVLDLYLAEARPLKIGWIGQRYINAVQLPIDDSDVPSYFTLYPTLPAGSSLHRPFALQVQMGETKNSTVVVNLALESVDKTAATYLLDIYARSVGDVPNDVHAIKGWHTATHEIVRAAFKASTTEHLRALFRGET